MRTFQLTLKRHKEVTFTLQAETLKDAKELGAKRLDYPSYQALLDWGHDFLTKVIKQGEELK